MATIIAMTLAKEREEERDFLEGESVFDGGGELLGWLGQVMDDEGYPCEFMGMGDLGYTSCHSATEVMRLRAENAKLRELVRDMYGNYRTGWNEEIEDELYDRMRELGIEVKE